MSEVETSTPQRKTRKNPKASHELRVSCLLDWMKEVGIDFQKNQNKLLIK